MVSSPDLCSHHVREDDREWRWGRTAACAVAAVALIACSVLSSITSVVLDERTAMQLAEGANSIQRERIAFGGTRAEAAIPQFNMDQLAAAHVPAGREARQQTAILARVPGKHTGPVWPGLADFEAHEAKAEAASAAAAQQAAAKQLKAAKSDSRSTQSLEWNPNCPCRGGCPCPGHGHGSNIVRTAPAEISSEPKSELQRGLELGMALGLKIGLKAGLEEKGLNSPTRKTTQALNRTHPPASSSKQTVSNGVAAVVPDAARSLVQDVEHKYTLAEHAKEEVEGWEAQQKAKSKSTALHPATALAQPAMAPLMTGEAEDKYVQDIEKRLAAEEKESPTATAHAVSETALMKKVDSDLHDMHDGKTTNPSNSANLPWPFKRSHPTPYPEPKPGEFSGHPISPKAVATEQIKGMTATGKARYLDSLAAKQASHSADLDVITQDSFGLDKKAIGKERLLSAFERKAKAQATHDVRSIAAPFANAAQATADFDERAKSLEHKMDDASPQPTLAANPWLAEAVKAVHDIHIQIPRTVQQTVDDSAWKGQTDMAHREMDAAKRALAAVEGATSSVATLAGTQKGDAEAGDVQGHTVAADAEALGFKGPLAFAAHLRGSPLSLSLSLSLFLSLSLSRSLSLCINTHLVIFPYTTSLNFISCYTLLL